MEAQKHALTVTRTAHYYTTGEITPEVRHFWLACHGYGQAAASFIRKFDVLNPKENFVVAPEGLSRFYWGGFTGDVVASWMTSGDRLDEIADYCNYLQTVFDTFRSQLAEDVTVNIFGFSQGVATVLRWMFEKRPEFDNLIIWAGTIPDELDYSPYHSYLKDKNIQFFYGTEDELLTPPRLERLRGLAETKGLHWEENEYTGGHIVTRAGLQNLSRKL